MKPTDETIIREMRNMAKQGLSPAQILQSLHGLLPRDVRNKISLIHYFREAFSLSLQEASPIAGWGIEGSGEISDDRLDEFLVPAINRHLNVWDTD